MKCNMGNSDWMFRGIVGIAVLGAGLFFQSWWGLLGLVFLATATFSWCPAYVPFGINTGPKTDS